MDYAELAVTSNFSFLRGASKPQELVLAAALLGHKAIAIADRNTLAGIVRAHSMAKEQKIRLVVGARLVFDDAPDVLCFPRDYPAYARLCTLLTTGKRRAAKGQCLLHRADLAECSEGQILVALPGEALDEAFVAHLRALQAMPGRLYLAAHFLYRGDDVARLHRLGEIADALGIRLVATNDVHYHAAERRPLQDVLTCIRENCTIHEAGYRLYPNAERHLKAPAEMADLFAAQPDAIARTMEIVEQCDFSLDALQDIYSYPVDPVPEGSTPQQELERLAWEGAARRYPKGRYPAGIPDKVRTQIGEELGLIATLAYAPYFLTVHDIVRFARSQDILCQGRGSAANSTVCYVLGITEVDPAEQEMLFARFISGQRKEPPDIDVDFEHERREEVIQYIYKKYGRERAALAATVISYRPRSALRDVGKALGLSPDALKILAKAAWSWEREGISAEFVREAGLDPRDDTLRWALRLAAELIGFPRHLSQHVGGFVITQRPLYELVPIENAAMEDRTVIEWDKDDLEEAGLLKVDVLALGMLSCLRRGFALLKDHYGRDYAIADVPQADAPTFAMIQKADTIGVFQIESRAQMSMLPRLKPKEFYDLVVEVAIVRPGPIQGDMVHPYLKRREGKEAVTYPSETLKAILGRTLGVPLFQEQAMQIAIDAAGFTPEEADKLRRSMATFRRDGTIEKHRDKFIAGMVRNKYPLDFAERCFKQIEGFADYGFPESHAASFAILVYVSAWMKCHYPAVFAAALLNSQPMGFYAPAQIIRDAREHQVEVRPVDVNASHWDCTLEKTFGGTTALRLGFRQIKGFSEGDAKKLVEARGGGYATLRDAWRRSGLPKRALEILADADAWASLGFGRREALWQIKGLSDVALPLFDVMETGSPRGHNLPPDEVADEPQVVLPALKIGQQVIEDYRHLHFTLRQHPVALLRDRFPESVPHATLAEMKDGVYVTVTGLVLVRQQPGTAKGVIFVTLEDETGVANAIVWQRVFQDYRRVLLDSRLLSISGRLQREGLVTHIVADKLVDRSAELRRLSDVDGEFEKTVARGDVVRHPGRDPRDDIPEGRNFH